MSFDGDLYPTAGASSVMTTKGDVVRYDSQRERYGIGSANQVLQVSAGGLPAWQTLATASSPFSQLGEDSATGAGASQLQVGSFTEHDILSIWFYGCSAGVTESDIGIRLNNDSTSVYTMRGLYASTETTYSGQNHWSATFGNSIPQRPVNLQLTLWKQNSDVVGDGGLCGLMLGSANYDVSGTDMVNTLSSSGLLFDDTTAITSVEVLHLSDNILGKLQVNGMNYG